MQDSLGFKCSSRVLRICKTTVAILVAIGYQMSQDTLSSPEATIWIEYKLYGIESNIETFIVHVS